MACETISIEQVQLTDNTDCCMEKASHRHQYDVCSTDAQESVTCLRL